MSKQKTFLAIGSAVAAIGFVLGLTTAPVQAQSSCPIAPSFHEAAKLQNYQATMTEDKYIAFLKANLDLSFLAVYAKDRSNQFNQTGNPITMACLGIYYEAFAQDPTQFYTKFTFSDMNAQAIIEIDHTLRSLAYTWGENQSALLAGGYLTETEVTSVNQFFTRNMEFFDQFYYGPNSLRHAVLNRTWHELTKMVVANNSFNSTFFTMAENQFNRTVGPLIDLDLVLDRPGSVSSYYKQTLSVLVAMNEIHSTPKRTELIDKAVAKYLTLMEASEQQMYILPTEEQARKLMLVEPKLADEVVKNIWRLRHQYSPRTHMTWLTVVTQTDQVKRIRAMYANERFSENHVNR